MEENCFVEFVEVDIKFKDKPPLSQDRMSTKLQADISKSEELPQ